MTEFGCSDFGADNLKYPVAGLDPATHVLFDAKSAANEDVDDRVKPGQGEFCSGEGGKIDDSELENLNRTAVGQARP